MASVAPARRVAGGRHPADAGHPGRFRRSRRQLLGHASPLDRYPEEIDPRISRHLGNFPQAFTDRALINAVMHVIRADKKLAAGMQPLSAHADLLPDPPAI
jgi:hypothetical protein